MALLVIYSREAGMAELVDANDSKSFGATHESSILSPGTRKTLVTMSSVFSFEIPRRWYMIDSK